MAEYSIVEEREKLNECNLSRTLLGSPKHCYGKPNQKLTSSKEEEAFLRETYNDNFRNKVLDVNPNVG